MRRRTTATFFAMTALFLALAATPAAAEDKGGWEAVGVYDDVRVERKTVPGSPLFAFRGEFIADVHIGKVISVFIDRDQRKFWVDRFAETALIEKGSELSETYWIHFALPFPIKDRDYVLRADAEMNPDTHVFTAKIKSVEDARRGEEKCCVRADAKNTYYRFEALPGGKTRLFVEVHTDPKGSLPNWLINMIQKKWPSKTLSRLVKRAREAGTIPAELANWHGSAPAAAQ